MAEQSHRDEMSAAIRAQRERRAAPRSIAPDPEHIQEHEQEHEPEAEQAAEPQRKGLLGRLRGK